MRLWAAGAGVPSCGLAGAREKCSVLRTSQRPRRGRPRRGKRQSAAAGHWSTAVWLLEVGAPCQVDCMPVLVGETLNKSLNCSEMLYQHFTNDM